MRKLIRVCDTETTGMDPSTDVVVDLGICDLVDEGRGWEVQSARSKLFFAHEIPPEVRAVHHIRAADVAHCDPFDPSLFWSDAEAEGVVVVASHNMEFDGPFLPGATLPRLCTLKAAYRIWPDAPAHNNGALRYWLEDQGLIAPIDHLTHPPHRAGPDAYVTAWILKALLNEATANQMVAWTKEPRLLPTCPIGKQWRGRKWADVETGFLTWMLNQQDMESDFLWNARRELDRRRMAA